MTTLHAYHDLLHAGGRLAPTAWPGASVEQSIAATLAQDPHAVILGVNDSRGLRLAIGYAPGGMS